MLVGERGAYRLATALRGVQVPATVQAILAARIDRLPTEDKRLLQAAAVIGKDVPFALLQAIADVPEDALRRGLSHLQAAEFLYETSLFPDLEYTFKHAFTHEVAYGSVLQERRRTLHAQVVEAIERCYTDRLTEQVERLAHHALRGDHVGKAVTYLRQAGAKASARSAYREAVATSSGRWRRSVISLRVARRWSRPSIFASTSEARSSRSAIERRSFEHLREAERWPGSSMINNGSHGRRCT